MNRKLGFGALSLMVALAASFMIPEDADAFGGRKRRRGGGSHGGYSHGSHGGYNAGHHYSNGCATGGCATTSHHAAPIASSGCDNCTVGHSGSWSGGQAGGYNAGAGHSVMGGQQGQPTLNSAPQAPQGPEAGATFRSGNASGTEVNPTRSPSDAAAPPAPGTGATNDDPAVRGISGADSGNNANASQAPNRSAPPAPPSSEN